MHSLLKAINLGYRKAGESWLFKSINLRINPGELILICGPVGSGKTMLVDLLSGWKKPQQGLVEWTVPVGVVTQEFTLYKDLTVQENLEFICAINDNLSADKFKLLAAAGLTGQESTKTARLPAGLQKMLQTACAVARKSPLLILDEPVTGLDDELRKKFWILMEQLTRDGKAALIMTNQLENVSATKLYRLSSSGLTEITEPPKTRIVNEWQGVG